MHSSEHELVDAFVGPTCVVCALSAGAARAHLKGVLQEGVNDVRLRDDWRRRGGICARHWRVWRGLDSPSLSSSILARDLLAHALEAGGAAGEVRCRACEVEAKATKRYLDVLGRLSPARLASALEGGRGFACLRHLAAVPAGPRRDLLRARLEAVVDDLDTFVRLSDHRFASEPKGGSGDAWLRAIRALGGEV
jgi:hypothetical protein